MFEIYSMLPMQLSPACACCSAGVKRERENGSAAGASSADGATAKSVKTEGGAPQQANGTHLPEADAATRTAVKRQRGAVLAVLQ